MKKSLIALAALAVVSAASAQSSVTVSGNLDFAASSSSGTVTTMSNASTVSTNIGASSTSVIRFIAVEDLGGGLKATAQYNFDPRTLANDSGAVTNNIGNANTAAGSSLGATFTGLQRDELFVGLSGAFGNVRLGSPNSIGLGAHGDSSPLGTGIGAGYTANGVSGTMTNSYVQTRYNRSARYDSPTIAGFTASAMYAPGGDEVAVTATSTALAGGANAALTIPNARKATELGLAYANGPLKVSYAYVAQDAQTNATGWYANVGTVAANTLSNAKTNVSMLNGNYTLGNTVLYAGWNSGDILKAPAAAATAPTTTKGYRLAVKHTIGAIDLIGQYTTQDSKVGGTAAAVKAKVTGLRADYNLSKTAAVYLGYENYDSGANTTANIHKVSSLGLRKSF